MGWEDGTKAEGELTEEESVEDELLMADEDESEEEEWEATMTSPRARAATAEHAVATSPRTLSPAVAAAAAAAAANQAAAANAALLAEQQREAQQREVQEQRALQLAEQEILRAQQEQEVLLRKQLQRRQAEAEVEAEAEEARKAAQIAAAEASSSEGEYEEELDEEGYVSEEYEGREGESGDEECRLGNSPWFEFYANEETEEVYYFNEATGESSWDRPHIEGLDDLDDLDRGTFQDLDECIEHAQDGHRAEPQLGSGVLRITRHPSAGERYLEPPAAVRYARGVGLGPMQWHVCAVGIG